MNRRIRMVGLALLGAFSLGGLCTHALHEHTRAPLGAARAYAEAPPSAIHGAPQPTAAEADSCDPLAEDRKLSEPKVAVPAGTDVRLQLQADRRAVLLHSDGRVQVQLTLSTPEASTDAPRRASDILVVLDISGSMAGQKLAYAKRALHQLIDRLQAQDRFGLVTYESSAAVVVPLQAPGEGAYRRWHRAVDALETAGGTNMSAGLDLGLAELRAGGRREHMARVLLLSDGHANEGDSTLGGLQARARRIVRAEHVLTTMGIGDDFNEDLMSSLAEVGAGNFYYLSRIDTIGRFFDAELRASTQTVASALELRFQPAPGTVLLDVSGYPIEHDGSGFSLRPGNLFAGQKRTLWATLQVDTARVGQVELGRFSLAYKRDAVSQLVAAEPLPALECVAERERFERGVDKKLWEEAVLGNQLQQGRIALGKAISDGNDKDVDRQVKQYENNRALAESLGSQLVLQSLDTMRQEGESAKAAQAAPAAARGVSAKKAKATGLFKLRSDAYKEDPAAGMW